MAKVYPQIQAIGGQLLAISPQSTTLNLGLRERRTLPFPILADAGQAVIRQWGLFNDLDPKQRLIPYPATYIVGQDGRIVWAYIGLETRDRPPIGEILAALKKLAPLKKPDPVNNWPDKIS